MKIYHVYRCYDADDQLLYVGVTTDMRQRHTEHAGQKEWYSEVARIETEEFDSGDEAAEREMVLLTHERPRYNSPTARRYTAHLRPAREPSKVAALLIEARSIRLTAEDRRILELLAQKLGVNQTAVIKQAIRRLAEREGIR